MAFYDFDTTETDYQCYSDTFERAERAREERDMRDWQAEDFSRLQVREEAADSMLPQLCDGSGVVEEIWLDVDLTRVISCKGCPACDGELVEFVGRRKPMASETVSSSRKEVA